MNDQQLNERLYSLSLNDREIGALITQVEILRDAVKTVQITVTDILLNKKDIDHSLEDITKSFVEIKHYISNFENEINKLDEKISEHIKIDKPVFELFEMWIGKRILIWLSIGLTGVIFYFQNYIKEILINLLK